MRPLPTLFLAAVLLPLAPALAQAQKKEVAPPAVQQQFADFIAKFRTAVKANDSAAVADLTKLPYQRDEAKLDAAQFRAKVYPGAFTAKNRACIQRAKATYSLDGDNNDNYFMFCNGLTFIFTKTPAGFMLSEVSDNND